MKQTMQGTFNEVVGHLRSRCNKFMGTWQGTPDFPLYRDVENNEPGCGVGILISEKDYNYSMEGHVVRYNTLVKQALEKNGHDIDLCTYLQNIHDIYHSSLWEFELKNLAKEIGLDYYEPVGAPESYVKSQISNEISFAQYMRVREPESMVSMRLKARSEKLLAIAESFRPTQEVQQVQTETV
jgi:hypothetical protein